MHGAARPAEYDGTPRFDTSGRSSAIRSPARACSGFCRTMPSENWEAGRAAFGAELSGESSMRPAKRLPLKFRLNLFMTERRLVDGIRLAVSGGKLALDRIEEALGLIKRHEPMRFRRMKKDVDLIGVWLLPGPLGCFDTTARASIIDGRFVLDDVTTPAMIASVIVHEACHARLEALGIDYSEDRRARIEALCKRQELRFAARLQDQTLIDWNSGWDTGARLSDRDMAEDSIAGHVEALRHLGVPDALIRVLVVLRRLRDAVRRWSVASEGKPRG